MKRNEVAAAQKPQRKSREELISDENDKDELDSRSLQGYPGRALEVAHTRGALAKVHLFYANKRMYQLSVSAPQKTFPAQDAQRFFASLSLMKR